MNPRYRTGAVVPEFLGNSHLSAVGNHRLRHDSAPSVSDQLFSHVSAAEIHYIALSYHLRDSPENMLDLSMADANVSYTFHDSRCLT